MPLENLYTKAIVKQYGFPPGWMANWPAGFDQSLGLVGTIEDGSFNRDGVLSDYGIAITPDPDRGREDGPWTYTSESVRSIDIGVDATVPGWEWIGNAKAGLKLGFGSELGLVITAGASRMEHLLRIDRLKTELLEAGKAGKLKEGQAVIVEQQIADNGLVITSEGREGTFEATTSFDVKPGGTQTLASFGASFAFHSQTASVAHHSFPNGFTVAFRVIKLDKRGWLWWRHFDVVGVREVEPSRDDYFAVYPDAEL